MQAAYSSSISVAKVSLSSSSGNWAAISTAIVWASRSHRCVWPAASPHRRGSASPRAGCRPGEETGDVGCHRLPLGPADIEREGDESGAGLRQIDELLFRLQHQHIVRVRHHQQREFLLILGVVAMLIGADILRFDLPPLRKQAGQRLRVRAKPQDAIGSVTFVVQHCGGERDDVGDILFARLEEDKPLAGHILVRIGLQQHAARLHIVPVAQIHLFDLIEVAHTGQQVADLFADRFHAGELRRSLRRRDLIDRFGLVDLPQQGVALAHLQHQPDRQSAVGVVEGMERVDGVLVRAEVHHATGHDRRRSPGSVR